MPRGRSDRGASPEKYQPGPQDQTDEANDSSAGDEGIDDTPKADGAFKEPLSPVPPEDETENRVKKPSVHG